jgi:hypothetical protein
MIAAKIPLICAHNLIRVHSNWLFILRSNKPDRYDFLPKNYFNITPILIVEVHWSGIKGAPLCFINWLIKIKLLTHGGNIH